MTNTRKKQIRTLAILLVAVVALTVGFAAFTSSLRIKTRLSVNPNKGTFNVKFSKVSNELDENNVIPQKSSDIFEAFEGIIDNSGIPTISDLGGEFTQPGESITYEFYALNTGEYKAYLTDVIFGNVDGESTNKVCTSLDGTHQSEVDIACSNISIKVTVGSDILTTTRSNLVGHNLEPNASEKVKVEITYSSGGILPEVPFEVSFGDISMVYNSLEAGDSAPTPEDNSYCFVSFAPGVISLYDDSCSKDVNIPSTLELPVATISDISFNDEKCAAFEESQDMQDICSTYKPMYESGKQQIISEFTRTPDLYENLQVNDADANVGLATAIFANVLDIDYDILDSTKYTINTIGSGSFAVKNIDSIVLNDNISIIGPSAFPKDNLTSITLPNKLTAIYAFAFSKNQLTSIDIPNSVTYLGFGTFNSNNLTSVSISNNLAEIKSNTFNRNNISTIDFKNTNKLTTIGSYSFSDNNLSTLEIPDSVTILESGAFYENNLTSIAIPDSVTTIGSGVFNANKLTSVEIGSGITSIGNYAFGNHTETIGDVTYGPNALTSVVIKAPKSQIVESYNYMFSWDQSMSCTDSGTINDSCITWQSN